VRETGGDALVVGEAGNRSRYELAKTATTIVPPSPHGRPRGIAGSAQPSAAIVFSGGDL
jgi:hypothetical protein